MRFVQTWRSSGKRSVLLILVICLFTSVCWAESPNTIIALHTVELNNKGKPITRTYAERYNRVVLTNQESDDERVVEYGGLATQIYLEPGVYCFKSVYINSSQFLGIVNPLCFLVEAEGITNAGTWVIGTKVTGSNWYAAMVDVKANYDELAGILGVQPGAAATVLKPKPVQ